MADVITLRPHASIGSPVQTSIERLGKVIQLSLLPGMPWDDAPPEWKERVLLAAMAVVSALQGDDDVETGPG